MPIIKGKVLKDVKIVGNTLATNNKQEDVFEKSSWTLDKEKGIITIIQKNEVRRR